MKLKYVLLALVCLQVSVAYGGEEIVMCTKDRDRHGYKCHGTVYTDPDYHDPFPSAAFWIDILIILAMLLVAGMMSGLTLGLLSLDIMNLEIIVKTGEPKDVRNAKRIIPLVKKHHQLLVTLLLANAAAMEALPLALDKLVPEWAAIVISITLVLMFGEIIPQAICSRYGLRIGASLSWVVWIVMYALSPISYPLGKALDHFLGKEEGTYFNRSELRELLAMHGGPNAPPGSGLTVDETTIMRGALELKDKNARDIMMPMANVFMLNAQEVLDEACLQRIYESKRSRIPIFTQGEDDDENITIIGCILVKSLIVVRSNPKIEDLNLRPLPVIPADMSLYDLLNLFQEGKSHMAIVVDEEGIAEGIVTLEDVIEELIQEEIYDEADVTNVRSHHILRIRSPKAKPVPRSNSDPNPLKSKTEPVERRMIQRKSVPMSRNLRRRSVAVMDSDRESDNASATSRRSSLVSSGDFQGRPRFHSPQVRAPPKLHDDEGDTGLESIREVEHDDEDDQPVAPGTPLL